MGKQIINIIDKLYIVLLLCLVCGVYSVSTSTVQAEAGRFLKFVVWSTKQIPGHLGLYSDFKKRK